MKDWASHLAAMQRNKVGHVNDPQGVWIRAYRAAPTNINGFEKAMDNFDPAKLLADLEAMPRRRPG